MKKSLLLVLGTASALVASARTMPIILQNDLIPSEKTAERELREYLQKVTGETYESFTEDRAPSGPAIRLVADPAMGPEEWSVKTEPNGSIVIRGGRRRGVLYGVYHFLEDVLGVRWLSPVAEHVPTRKGLDGLGKLDMHGKPAMPYRSIYLVPGNGGTKFLARNRMNTASAEYGGCRRIFGGAGDCHTMYTNLGTPDEVRQLFKEHPDWFPLIDGKRYCHVERANSGAQSQLCLTNPELRRYWTDKLRERLRKDRAAADAAGTDRPMYYAIDQNDCYDGFCKCPTCQAIVDREGSNAGLLLDFSNYVAEQLESEAPEARFQMMALHSTEKPPKAMKARRNVTIRLCDTTSNELVPWTDPENAKHLDNLKAWMAHADSISMWDYQITYGSASVVAHPTPAERTFAADIRTLRDCKGDGFFFEHESPVAADMRDLKVWVESKLAENPDLDGDELIRTFTDLYYGPEAGAIVREYRLFLEKTARDAKARVGWFPSLSAYRFLTGEAVYACYRLYARAVAAVRDDSEKLQRVRHAFLSLDRLYLARAATLKRQLAKADPEAKLPNVDKVIENFRRVFEQEMKSRGYDEEMAGVKSGLKDFLAFVEKAKDLPVPEAFKDVPQDALFLYPATFASTFYRGMKFVDDPSSPAGRALTANMQLVKKNPHEYYPLSSYDWPLRCRIEPTMKGTIVESLKNCPREQPAGYRWYKVASAVPLKTDSRLFALNGSYIPLDGAVSDNSELGQKYDIWVSVKIEGPDVCKTGKADWDTIYFLDQVAVVRKTCNAGNGK